MLVQVVPWCSQTTSQNTRSNIDPCICVALYVVHMISFKQHCFLAEQIWKKILVIFSITANFFNSGGETLDCIRRWMNLILHYLTPYMGSQNMGNIVFDLVPAQDQAIMLNNIDILSMANCKQIQWHLNETTTDLIKENPKYCLQGAGHFIWVSTPCHRKGSRVTLGRYGNLMCVIFTRPFY